MKKSILLTLIVVVIFIAGCTQDIKFSPKPEKDFQYFSISEKINYEKQSFQKSISHTQEDIENDPIYLEKITGVPIQKTETYEADFSNVNSLTVSGNIDVYSPMSFGRVIAIDDENKEYLIYANDFQFILGEDYEFDEVCDETCILDSKNIKKIRLEVHNSKLIINSIYTSKTSPSLNKDELRERQQEIRLSNLQNWIEKNDLEWSPEINEFSKKTYAEKKGRLYTPHMSLFYKGGTFSLPGLKKTEESSGEKQLGNIDFIPGSFSWTDMFGTSWVTEIKYQGNYGTCWAFSGVGAIESQYLLTYFPDDIYDFLSRPWPGELVSDSSVDLSEAELIHCCQSCVRYPEDDNPDNYCHGSGSEDEPRKCYAHGGLVYRVMKYAQMKGLVDESTARYSDFYGDGSDVPNSCCLEKISEPECPYSNLEDIPKLDHYFEYFNYENPLDYNTIKYLLFLYGPMAASFDYGNGNHGLVIVGYSDWLGDKLEVKNSWYGHSSTHFIDLAPHAINIPIFYLPSVPEFCTNDDSDDLCFWGPRGFFQNQGKPATCNNLDCGRDIPDWDDDNFNVGGATFACGYDADNDGNYCDPWEACWIIDENENFPCYEECKNQDRDSGTDSCCGDGICEEGLEDCSNCFQDCSPCPECSDHIDNDGDGYIDHAGYIDSELDSDCGNALDDSESPPPDCTCGDDELCEEEICELNQESNVICFDAINQENQCFGPFGSDSGYWDKGIWKDNVCYPIFGTTTRECEDCETWNPNWDNCKICTAVEGINPGDYVERVYATDTECRQKRYSDDQWISMPFEDYTPYNPPGGWGKPKIEMTDQPPGGPLRSQEKDSFWDWIICFITGCPDDDWEPSEG